MILIGLEFKNAEMNIIGVLLALKLIALNSFLNSTNIGFQKKGRSDPFKHKMSLGNCSSTSAK